MSQSKCALFSSLRFLFVRNEVVPRTDAIVTTTAEVISFDYSSCYLHASNRTALTLSVTFCDNEDEDTPPGDLKNAIISDSVFPQTSQSKSISRPIGEATLFP